MATPDTPDEQTMAKTVLGIGTAHSPMLNLNADQWRHRADVDFGNPALATADGRFLTYAELLAERNASYADRLDPAQMEAKAKGCQDALDKLGDLLEKADPDVVLVVGDDQTELFTASNRPAFAIFHGDELITTRGKYAGEVPDWMTQIGKGFLMDDNYRLPGHRDLALKLITGMTRQDVEVTSIGGVPDPSKAGFGHAYGFIARRLYRRSIPMIPVMLNTFYQPNVPNAGRAYDLGVKLKNVIESIPDDLRVAIVASGGLSHFVVDEELDHRVLKAFADKDAETLRSIPREALNSGNSEILNWILVGGAVADMPLVMSEYFDLVRSEAGTGIGAGFVAWKN